MSNICLLLTKMIGGRKGPSGFTLSGTITGDEAEGVTITLTGDASDSTTSAADGTYSFTGLSNGDYNVEPSLEGYIFDPTDIDVTIASADDFDNDFVSSGVYTISGTIVDGAAAGIEGVTVALTGDATDSTTTAANGTYSFTGIPDGSYTVTPTFTNLKMTPASRAANVSGDNVALDNIVGQYLLIPYTYNMSDITPSSGDLITLVDEWYADNDGDPGPAITTSVADNNSFTPSGVTKGATWYWDSAKEVALCKFPFVVDPSVTSIRVAALGFSNAAARFTIFGLWNSLQTTGVTADNFGYAYVSGSANPDTATTAARYNTSTTRSEVSGFNTTVNEDAQRYHWHRAWWDFSTGKVGTALYRPEDSSLIWTTEQNMHSDGTTLGHVWTNTQYFFIANIGSGDNYNIVKLWVGSGSDDWPT